MTLLPVEKELENARAARAAGKEGLARVCARRAAGMAIREYLRVKAINSEAYSLNDLIKSDLIRGELPGNIHPFLEHLSTRVDTNYQLDAGIDLIGDAEAIIEVLFNLQEKK